MRILVDTNVFLDYLLEREDFENVGTFFRLSFMNKNQLFATSMSLRDIGYATHQMFHNEKTSKEIQFKTYQLCRSIIPITGDDVINVLYSDYKDFEDGLIREAAEREMIDVIVTNNIRDYRKMGFPALTPKEINEIYLKQQA